MTLTQLMRPFRDRPKPGQSVRIFLSDGSQEIGHCTLLHMNGASFIQWYDAKTRNVIDVNKIKGWMPIARQSLTPDA